MEAKEAPRKSNGAGFNGRPYILHNKEQFAYFNDHAGNPVISAAWSAYKVPCHPLGLQVYPLGPLSSVKAQDIALALAKRDTGLEVHDKRTRIDVYSPQASIEDCMSHQRLEKEHRRQTGGLNMVPVWIGAEQGLEHRNWIFVIDKDSCSLDSVASVLEKGLSSVVFDLCQDPEDEFEFDDCDDSDSDMVIVEMCPKRGDPHMEPLLMTRGHATELRCQLTGEFIGTRSFDDLCLMVIRDCLFQGCYDAICCWDCEDNVEHDECRDRGDGNEQYVALFLAD